MKIIRIIFFMLFLGSMIIIPSCGKKGSPFLPKKEFSFKVVNLEGRLSGDYIILKGKIEGFYGARKATGLVKGCRVYYGQYPLTNPPCAGCPIKYHGYHEFGPEVVTGEGFFCQVQGEKKGQINFFKVYLTGSDSAVGPSSKRIRVIVE